ncbi:MAG: septum formation protein Maf [Flavobacteriia bacterium]|nr:septum formation protein Maf [Flavobacteriia bacterium]OIP46881.1 MAG: septum formation protein Maf [Flavobacteriaceae bacterium CG2_30_31_66]PIV97054.1 MAG: septum formation protein Maf [Flavobacteriaceae bacterium CG17_big_fil_post_rev_8_21_14_2_50_31_13]PIX14310.1 MAG: septum formation protein Maf [Flavobacteriaceae bacterium CG_4_8_14_3_um_filter_31_8]PIY16318.1 MAG: septum formation protein Maf [Flavobacteriaceae bacterium CG_4_10_14_3_um_filter_31_253]PIZ12193.1 MAG: septum formation 
MLSQKLSYYNIILASASPRRQQFFKELNIDFTVQVKSVNELYPSHLKAIEITDYLADLKSKAFTNLAENDLIITSDTIVWLENEPLEKVSNEKEAFAMLKKISGKKHEVITSVCIKTAHFQKIFNDTTQVYFKELTDEEIHYYIQNYQPFDKAGAYGIQEWIGYIGVEKIEGSYFNVMGLPVHKLYKELQNL